MKASCCKFASQPASGGATMALAGAHIFAEGSSVALPPQDLPQGCEMLRSCAPLTWHLLAEEKRCAEHMRAGTLPLLRAAAC